VRARANYSLVVSVHYLHYRNICDRMGARDQCGVERRSLAEAFRPTECQQRDAGLRREERILLAVQFSRYS